MVLSATQTMRAPKAQQATLVLTSSLQTRWDANLGAGETRVLLTSCLQAADHGSMQLNNPWMIYSF